MCKFVNNDIWCIYCNLPISESNMYHDSDKVIKYHGTTYFVHNNIWDKWKRDYKKGLISK